jgi:hypothetical protein
MLISMPTGTSTIFGVFQAILALLVASRTKSALTGKLIRNEKFASEIFCNNFPSLLVASQKEFTGLCGLASNERRINGFRVVLPNPEPIPVRRQPSESG